MLYKCAKTHQDFWEYTIKEIVSEYGKAKQNHPPTTARFIFLGAYNFTPGPDQTIANTFASFTADYGARWLSFARDELSELLERAGANMFSHKIVFEASTIDFILNITGGHVGFNILGLECLQDVEKALRSSGEMTTIDILAVYSGKAFRRAIQSPRLRWNDAIFTKSTEKAIVRYLLCQTDKKCSWAQLKRKFPGEGTGPSDDLTALISRSVIQKLDDRSSAAQEYGFPSPVLASLLCEIVLQTTETDYLIEPKNIYDFIRQILPNFNFRALAKTHSTGTGGLVYERALQMEFNRCAVRALGVDYDCCPDVGYKWKSDGYLDFYIDSGEFQWGIEILRNSVQLVQHCNRKDEIYSPIPMKAYVVLNFVELRSGSPSEHLHKIPQPKLEEQEIRVIWTPRETHFVVLQAGWEAEKTDFNIVEDKLMQEVANGLLAALRQDGGRP